MRDYTKFELSEVLINTLGTNDPRLKIVTKEENIRGRLLTEIVGFRELLSDRDRLCVEYFRNKESSEAGNYLAVLQILESIPVQMQKVQTEARGKPVLQYDPNRVL